MLPLIVSIKSHSVISISDVSQCDEGQLVYGMNFTEALANEQCDMLSCLSTESSSVLGQLDNIDSHSLDTPAFCICIGYWVHSSNRPQEVVHKSDLTEV